MIPLKFSIVTKTSSTVCETKPQREEEHKQEKVKLSQPVKSAVISDVDISLRVRSFLYFRQKNN
jgi:hypothetical protein